MHRALEAALVLRDRPDNAWQIGRTDEIAGSNGQVEGVPQPKRRRTLVRSSLDLPAVRQHQCHGHGLDRDAADEPASIDTEGKMIPGDGQLHRAAEWPEAAPAS